MDPLEAVEVEARCFVMRGSKAFPSNLRVKPKPGIVKESVEYTIMTATEPDRKKSLGGGFSEQNLRKNALSFFIWFCKYSVV
jgi:hypothetical protein